MFFKKKKPTPKAIAITDQNFTELILETEKPALLDFTAAWCGPCKVLGPIIDELAGEFKDQVIIGKVNVDGNPRLSEAFMVKSVPTLVFIKEKKMIERISGLVPKPNLEEMINDLINYQFEEEE